MGGGRGGGGESAPPLSSSASRGIHVPHLTYNARLQNLINAIDDLNRRVWELDAALEAFDSHPVESETYELAKAMLATRAALHALLFPGAPPTTALAFHVEQRTLALTEDA